MPKQTEQIPHPNSNTPRPKNSSSPHTNVETSIDDIRQLEVLK